MNKVIADKSVSFVYKNWKGETSLRTVIPISLWYGSTEFHPESQWLLRAWDCVKKAERDFAMADISGWSFGE